MGFLTAFATGAATGVLNEQNRRRDTREEETKAFMERLNRLRDTREKQIEERATQMQQAQLLGGNVEENAAALQAGVGFQALATGQAGFGPRPASAAPGNVQARAPAPGAAPAAAPAAMADPRAAGGNATERAFNQVHREESGGRMEPGITGDGGRAGGPGQVHQAALTDVNHRNGTNYTHQQLIDNPTLGRQVARDYYGMLVEKYNGDHRMAAAAYNGGQGNLDRRGFAGMDPRAQRYGDRVAAAAGTSTGGGTADARGSAAAVPRPVTEQGSVTAQAPDPEAGMRPPSTGTLPPLPQMGGQDGPVEGMREPAVAGPQYRAVMDRIFGSADPEVSGRDARRRFAGANRMSLAQVDEMERPLPRAQLPAGSRFRYDEESPGALAKEGRSNAQRLLEIDRTNDGRVQAAEATAAARLARSENTPLTSAASNTLATTVDRFLSDGPRAPFRSVARPDGTFGLIPTAITNSPAAREAIAKKGEAYALAERIYMENPRGGFAAAAQQAARQVGLLRTEEGGAAAPAAPRTQAPAAPGARQPAPAARPAASGERLSPEQARALPPGTEFTDIDGNRRTRR